MPRATGVVTATKSTFAWTRGKKRSIAHEAFIGRGGFGEVHKMKKIRTAEVFARKILRLVGSVTPKQIDEEVRIMTDLCKGECRFVVKVLEHDWLEYESLYFIDMEFCSQNLHDYIRQNSANFVRRPNFKEPPIPKNMESELEIVQPNTGAVTAQPPPSNTPVDHDIGWEPIGTIIENIVSGLNYIHGKKVVHRDLKPQNVLYSEKDGLWKLADFGSAAYTASKSRVTTHERRGTDSYRAPEIIQLGYFNDRSDIFALGCIVFEVIVGRALFRSDWDISIYAEKNESIFPDHWPTSPSGSILYQFGELSAKMLSSTPSERPGAATVLDRLQKIRNGGHSIDSSLLAYDDIFPPMNETTEAGILLHNPIVQTSYYSQPVAPNSNRAAERDLRSEKPLQPPDNHSLRPLSVKRLLSPLLPDRHPSFDIRHVEPDHVSTIDPLDLVSKSPMCHVDKPSQSNMLQINDGTSESSLSSFEAEIEHSPPPYRPTTPPSILQFDDFPLPVPPPILPYPYISPTYPEQWWR